MTARALGTEVGESPPVAAAEARAAAPARVNSMAAMTHSRLLTVGIDSLLVEVAALLSNAKISLVVVCDAAGLPVGTIAETVLIRHLGLGQADFFSTNAGDVATREIVSCSPDDALVDVLSMMHTRGFIHVLVVDPSNEPIGVLNARNGLRA